MPKRQTRRGGAFVRKGSYGCAFAKPPLKCQGEPSRRPSNELSKLLEYTKAYEEYQESVPFQRIDPEKRYFLWAHHMCPLDTKSVTRDNHIEYCTERNRGQKVPTVNVRKNPTLLFYEFGGNDISDIVITSGQYGPFLASFGNLLKGLTVMHENGIAHLDIKPLNIVSMETSTGEFSTRFIDFGLAVSTVSGTSKNPRILGLSPQNYPWWPFDFRFLSRSHIRFLPNEFARWYDQLFKMAAYLPQSSYWRRDWSPKFNTVQAQIVMGQYPWEYREQILQELDVYALGVTLSEVFATKTNHIMRTENDKDTIVIQLASGAVVPVSELYSYHVGGDSALVLWHKIFAEKVSMPFYTLIKQMIEFDPKKRITATDAIAYFNINLADQILTFFKEFDTFTQKALQAVGIRVKNTPMHLRITPPLSSSGVSSGQTAYTGLSEPVSVVSTTSTAVSEPRQPSQANIIVAPQLPVQPALPVKVNSGPRYGIMAPQKTGLNVLRELGPSQPIKPLVQQNPFYKKKNSPVKPNKTRKFKFF